MCQHDFLGRLRAVGGVLSVALSVCDAHSPLSRIVAVIIVCTSCANRFVGISIIALVTVSTLSLSLSLFLPPSKRVSMG